MDSEKSLIKQSCANPDRLQKDGWGVGFFKSGEVRIIKSRGPIFKEEDKVRKISGEADIFLAHIREASNPKKLPHKKLISQANSQPFSAQGFIFCHNGTLCIPDAVSSNLGGLKKNLKGVNDSEVLFWQIIKSLNAYGDPVTAIRMSVDEIETVWISVKKEYEKKGIATPYKGLNIILASKEALYALCLYPENSSKKAILTPSRPFGKMAYRKEGKTFIFASEPLDGGKWENLENGFILSAVKSKNEITLRKEKL